jgi:cysteine desulfurase
MGAALALTGNASSVHAEGRAARRLIEQAREDVARLIGAESRNVTFTSGATEANALALTPAIEIGGRREPRDRLIISAIEHPSVLSGGRFSAGEVEVVPVTSDGVVDLDALRPALTRSERPLVSVMLANNESGVQPIAEVADIVHAVGGVLHVDAVQAWSSACDIGALGADLMSIPRTNGGPQEPALVRRYASIGDPLIRGCQGADCGRERKMWRPLPDLVRCRRLGPDLRRLQRSAIVLEGPQVVDTAGGIFKASPGCPIRACSRFPD